MSEAAKKEKERLLNSPTGNTMVQNLFLNAIRLEEDADYGFRVKDSGRSITDLLNEFVDLIADDVEEIVLRTLQEWEEVEEINP